jgi:hypothetical protein
MLEALTTPRGTFERLEEIQLVDCREQYECELATMMLQARGFEAYNLEGGIEAWAREGLPYPAPDGSPGRVA